MGLHRPVRDFLDLLLEELRRPGLDQALEARLVRLNFFHKESRLDRRGHLGPECLIRDRVLATALYEEIAEGLFSVHERLDDPAAFQIARENALGDDPLGGKPAL